MAAKGGHNLESHNHNDVGNVILYRDGKPVLIDIGVGTCTKQTFSEDRYDIWTMQSAYHNLPTVNGTMQNDGATFAASALSYSSDDGAATFSLDLADAYPEEAGLESWVRTVSLEREEAVVITDSFRLRAETDDILMSLITPCQVEVGEDGCIQLVERGIVDGRPSGHAILKVSPHDLSIETERIPLDDINLTKNWGDHLTRILIRPSGTISQETWTLRIT